MQIATTQNFGIEGKKTDAYANEIVVGTFTSRNLKMHSLVDMPTCVHRSGHVSLNGNTMQKVDKQLLFLNDDKNKKS
jgi:hypothetical protein